MPYGLNHENHRCEHCNGYGCSCENAPRRGPTPRVDRFAVIAAELCKRHARQRLLRDALRQLEMVVEAVVQPETSEPIREEMAGEALRMVRAIRQEYAS